MKLPLIGEEVSTCRRCDRLVEWRERIGVEKRRAFLDWEYWARPVPGFGDPEARILVVGLAPAAHGANRTGRMFTGDRSGDWLFAALHRAGLASQPTSTHVDDGLRLRDVFVTAAVKCAPPDNKPTTEERNRCQPFLVREMEALPRARVIVCLGKFGWDQVIQTLRATGVVLPSPVPRFGHATAARLPGGLTLVGSYHPSQQNTFTGRLTEAMLDEVFEMARRVLEG
ncbi:MAG TPA: uracil-DNA glycosylase [Longimicrobiaceae bacterium]